MGMAAVGMVIGVEKVAAAKAEVATCIVARGRARLAARLRAWRCRAASARLRAPGRTELQRAYAMPGATRHRHEVEQQRPSKWPAGKDGGGGQSGFENDQANAKHKQLQT